MADHNTIKENLDGSQYIADILGAYFSTTENVLKRVKGQELASKYVGRIGFGADTVVNLQKILVKLLLQLLVQMVSYIMLQEKFLHKLL